LAMRENLGNFQPSAGADEEGDEREAALTLAVARALISLNKLQTSFGRVHEGEDSDTVFCNALSELYGIQNTGNVETMKVEVAKIVGVGPTRELLRAYTKLEEMERGQFLEFLRDMDSDLIKAIGVGLSSLRSALARVLDHAGGRRRISSLNSNTSMPAGNQH